MTSPSRAFASLRIAVVDDEPFVRGIFVRILQGLGVTAIDEYDDGVQALAGIGPATDVVVCDLNMPCMDGVTFLRHLSVKNYAGAVILLSGADERLLHTAEELAIAHNLRVVGSLHKPVTPPMFEPLLQRAMKHPESPAESTREKDLITRGELEAAIVAEIPEVWFQPKVCAATGRLRGAEALVRWRHPVYGLIPPSSFVPLAEETGLIDALTDLVMKKTLRRSGAWTASRAELHFAINVSVGSFARRDLPEIVVALAEASGFPLENLVLEVTESRLLSDVRGALETLSRLRLKGVGLAIDDFGTGHSSLAQLRRIPFTEMKIDRAFVHGASTDNATRVILEASAALGKKLGMAIVAEGVETREDLEVAVGAGVDIIQGFIVSPPVPPEEFERRFIDCGDVPLL